MTKAQIDKLGERLRVGAMSEPDLRLLDEYRRSFGPSYQEVMWLIREHPPLRLEPTGRFPKTPGSILAKLTREPSIRLSQVQDIAGCRIVVPHLEDQIVALAVLEGIFFESDPPTRVIDRRDKPSNGYRAIHLVVSVRDRAVEVQLRTALQHHWAELCEKFSDEFGGEIKYGGGPAAIQEALAAVSKQIATIEKGEQLIFEVDADRYGKRPPAEDDLAELREMVQGGRERTIAKMRHAMGLVQRGRLN